MQRLRAAITLFVAACGATAAAANSLTIGNTTFDFDAPAAPLTAAQQALFHRYKDAVDRQDETALMALQDDSIKSCAAIARPLILSDLRRTIPDDAEGRFFAAPPELIKQMGVGELMYLPVRPTAVLGISGRARSGGGAAEVVTILRLVRQTGDRFTLVPYCLTEKGAALVEPKPAPPW